MARGKKIITGDLNGHVRKEISIKMCIKIMALEKEIIREKLI